MERTKLIAYTLSTIEEILGPHTAASYREFYEQKNEQEILDSFTELLTEYLGLERARPYLRPLINNSQKDEAL